MQSFTIGSGVAAAVLLCFEAQGMQPWRLERWEISQSSAKRRAHSVPIKFSELNPRKRNPSDPSVRRFFPQGPNILTANEYFDPKDDGFIKLMIGEQYVDKAVYPFRAAINAGPQDRVNHDLALLACILAHDIDESTSKISPPSLSLPLTDHLLKNDLPDWAIKNMYNWYCRKRLEGSDSDRIHLTTAASWLTLPNCPVNKDLEAHQMPYDGLSSDEAAFVKNVFNELDRVRRLSKTDFSREIYAMYNRVTGTLQANQKKEKSWKEKGGTSS